MAQPADSSKATDPDNNAEAMAQLAGSAAEKDVGADASAPYGTRSRNRNGNSRPNYAEDKDIEMDNYDYYHDKKDGDGPKKSTRQAAATSNGDLPRGQAASRKAAVAADDSKSVTANGSRDSNSSTASNSATTTNTNGNQTSTATHTSRKRKAASGATNQTSSTTSASRRGGQGAAAAPTAWPESNMLTFENCNGMPAKGRLVADDGTVLQANDHVYLVCEPPGEPYYLGRIMEFLHRQNDASNPVDALRINWYYRPKDIGRKAPDTRLVYATMHSDISPLTALRGKCQIRHRVEIDNLDDYRKTPDSFWYEKLYDRYIQKNYDLIPTSSIVNVPDKVKKVLDERWKFVLVEQGRGKELTSAVKLCKRCTGYCASNDSVDCAVCQHTYHMNCVRPPLLKKPSRGFAWSCAACSRAQERKLEARHTPNGNDAQDGDDDDFMDDEDDDMQALDTNRNSPSEDDKHHQGTAEQIYQASLWPYRYLGMHCKPEDALDYDDRIYPRASTRIGPRHQATVLPWPGRPVEYVKPLEIKRGKNTPKLSKEALAAHEAEKARRSKRPKWVQDEPPGYIPRGEDHDFDDPNCTAIPMWVSPPDKKPTTEQVISYMDKARSMDTSLDLPEMSTNLQDVALTTLLRNDYDSTKALDELPGIPRAEFDEPKLSATDDKRFEEAISKFGSELHAVMKHVKTMTAGQVVRHYYKWKKTERGLQVWGNYSGRKGKKLAKKAEAAATKIADDVADADDDSAFDSNKAIEKKRGFVCQFCSTTTSRQWRRAPNATQTMLDETGGKMTAKDRQNQPVVALCRRCAELWRRYAIRWEDVEEVAKKVAQAGGKAWKRKQDEELLKELQVVQDLGLVPQDRDSTPLSTVLNTLEPPRKKLKGAADREDTAASDAGSNAGFKRTNKTGENTPVPDIPQPRMLPCAICAQYEPEGEEHVSCRECRLTVHRHCYGIIDHRMQGKWVCDMCSNDKNPQVSINYQCVLCPVEHTEQEMIEQPKLTHHKKKMSDKDRERERLEVQQARKAADAYKKRQEELNRPVIPREPLKRTADNNWVHVTCAVWTPEVKFGNARAMHPSEGIPSIPRSRFEEVCQICLQANGACIPCHQCRTPFHVECARQHGHLLGFDVAPVKSSRRDQFNLVNVNGESGTMSAMLWCKDHIPTKTIVHQMYEIVDDSGLTALQLYVQNYKQADLTLTGSVRKANLMTNTARAPTANNTRRTSTATGLNGAWNGSVNGDSHDAGSNARKPGEKVCISCGIDTTPRWWPIDNSQERRLTNGHHGAIGSEAQKFVEQRKFQCHKCRKMARTPRSHAPTPAPSAPLRRTPDAQPLRPPQHLDTSHLPPHAGSLRSPSTGSDYRDMRAPRAAWPQPSLSDVPPLGHHGGAPPPRAHGLQAPSLSQTHGPPSLRGGPPPPPPAHHYTPGPPTRVSPYGDWSHRPGSQHGSPPRTMNGGSPTMHGVPPPMSGLTSLRPPPMSAPPPAAPIATPHHSPYGNSLPPSPRRLGGPAPPSSYMSPYHGTHSQPPPPPPAPVVHGLSNGAPPPSARVESFAHVLHPRGGSAYGAHHSRHGVAPSHEQPRPTESRPSSGASSNPSLRNLLS